MGSPVSWIHALYGPPFSVHALHAPPEASMYCAAPGGNEDILHMTVPCSSRVSIDRALSPSPPSLRPTPTHSIHPLIRPPTIHPDLVPEGISKEWMPPGSMLATSAPGVVSAG